MSDVIICPHCRSSVRLPNELWGQQVLCPECKEIFVADTPQDISAEPLPSVLPRASDAPPAAAAEALPARRRPLDDDEDDDLFAYGRPSHLFRPTGSIGLAVRVLLFSRIFLSLLLIGSNMMQYHLATRLVNLENVPQQDIENNDLRQAFLGILNLALVLATVIVFLIWFYRAYANQDALGVRRLKYSPGWAVGYWFIPIMNLFRPVQVAQEIWRNSDPKAVAWGDHAIVKSRNSALIGFWWAAWIINNLIGNVSLRMELDVNSPRSLQAATVVAMISEAAVIVSALLAVAVVWAIDARQAERARHVAENADARWQEDEVAP